MASLKDRMVGAALLNIQIYEEVEADTTATAQAGMVVIIAAIAGAVGSYSLGPTAAISHLVMALLGWLIWAGVTYLIGVHVFGGTATWGELLRTLGFAHAPAVFYVLGIIPVIGSLFTFAAMVWMLVCGIIAIRQALDFSTGKAVLTALLGWLVLIIPSMILGRMFMTVSV